MQGKGPHWNSIGCKFSNTRNGKHYHYHFSCNEKTHNKIWGSWISTLVELCVATIKKVNHVSKLRRSSANTKNKINYIQNFDSATWCRVFRCILSLLSESSLYELLYNIRLIHQDSDNGKKICLMRIWRLTTWKPQNKLEGSMSIASYALFETKNLWAQSINREARVREFWSSQIYLELQYYRKRRRSTFLTITFFHFAEMGTQHF